MKALAVAALNRFHALRKPRKAVPVLFEEGKALAPWRFDFSKPNALWIKSEGGKRVTVGRRSVISPATKIFALGSCFALEIRDALSARGFDTYPKWSNVEYDPDRHQPGPVFKGRHPAEAIAHYDTFIIRQELDRAARRARWTEADMWSVKGGAPGHPDWSPHFRNPYMRRVAAPDMDSLMQISDRLCACVDDGLTAADVVILTLGLTECFRNKANGLWIAQGTCDPRQPVSDLSTFHNSTYAENYENLIAIVDMLAALGKTTVLTVSPVPLSQTWTGEDVAIANATSKTTLRAAVGQVCRERPDVIYWPSFEVTWGRDIYRTMGGAHPHPEVVKEIVAGFVTAMS